MECKVVRKEKGIGRISDCEASAVISSREANDIVVRESRI